jgi:hypothetical protein
MSALQELANDVEHRLHNHALPDELPGDEHMIWQGSPSIRSTVLHVFHVRKVAVYFGVLMLWRFADRLFDQATLLDAATYAVWIVPIAAAGLALLVVLAILTARTTIYTITSKRVVMRIGIALSMTVNLPFKVVVGAGLKLFEDGSGDIALQLEPDSKPAYAVIWPHARRWHLKHPQPALRSIPNARDVADILSEALANLPVAISSASAKSTAIGGTGEPVFAPGLAYPTAAE